MKIGIALYSLLLLAGSAFGQTSPILAVAPQPWTQTEALQAILDKGGPLVYIPAGKYVTDKTIRIAAPSVVIWCEPSQEFGGTGAGVTIEAAEGAFKPDTDLPEASLAWIDGSAANVVHIHNCTFKMRRADYGPPFDAATNLNAKGYKVSEWRHALRVTGAVDVYLYQCRFEGSGGDGLYIGPDVPNNREPVNILRASRCMFVNNYRQGISVVAVRDGLIEDSVVTGTKGASPQAGIDVEPERGDAARVVIRRMQSIGNRGPAYMVNMIRATPTTPPSRIIFQQCTWDAVPEDQVHFRLAATLNHELPNGYLLPNIPKGTWIQWDSLVWRK